MWKTRLTFLLLSATLSFLLGVEVGFNRFVTTKKPHHPALFYGCVESCKEWDNVSK